MKPKLSLTESGQVTKANGPRANDNVPRTFLDAWASPAFTSLLTSLLLVLIVVVTAAGIWSATRAEKLLGRKDPQAVVIDEGAGQLTAFLFVPFNAGWITILVGFVAFRAFDIWKPYPIRRLEALESGLGIMGDDMLAGAYAAITLSLFTTLLLLL